MIKKSLMLAATVAAVALALAISPAQSASALPLGAVQIVHNYSGLCMTSNHTAGTTRLGEQLLMRPCKPGYVSEAWNYTSPGVISFAANTSLQAGWDSTGKMKLVASGNVFTYDAPGEPAGTFTADDNSTVVYLEWAGIAGSPEDTPLHVNPVYNSFTATFTITPTG